MEPDRLPLGLGLLGFIEPCSVGPSLLFVRYTEANTAKTKATQVFVFTLVRAIFIGLLGVLAAIIGKAFLDLQKAGWVLLGALYILLGIIHLAGKSSSVMRSIGPSLGRLSTTKGAAILVGLFGLNIPACTAPLLAALLGSVAVTGAARFGEAFLMMSIFGLA